MAVLLRLYLKLDSQALALCVGMPVIIFAIDGHSNDSMVIMLRACSSY